MEVRRLVNGALFDVEYDAMVVVKNIEFFSLCEHHMLPFWGKGHVAYLPRKKVIGLRKIPRIVDMFARRLRLQEHMTQELAQTIREVPDPLGVGVICEAQEFGAFVFLHELTNSVTSWIPGTAMSVRSTRMNTMNTIG